MNLNLRNPDMLKIECLNIRFFVGNEDESRDLSPQCFRSRDQFDFENRFMDDTDTSSTLLLMTNAYINRTKYQLDNLLNPDLELVNKLSKKALQSNLESFVVMIMKKHACGFDKVQVKPVKFQLLKLVCHVLVTFST